MRFWMNLISHRNINELAIHKVFLRSYGCFCEKNLLFKTAKHSKTRGFSARQDKKPRQGWRLPWLFNAVLRENIWFGAYKSLCEAALYAAFLFWNFCNWYLHFVHNLVKYNCELFFADEKTTLQRKQSHSTITPGAAGETKRKVDL